MTGPSSSPRGERAGTPGVTWDTTLVRTETVIDDDAPDPQPNRATPPASRRGSTGLTGPPPPDEPAAGRSCDAGHCDRPSIGWRLYRGWREWLPVCGLHMEGPASRTRIYDPEEQQ